MIVMMILMLMTMVMIVIVMAMVMTIMMMVMVMTVMMIVAPAWTQHASLRNLGDITIQVPTLVLHIC